MIVAAVLAIAIGGAYFRLSKGMISLAPLRGMIESGINGELAGLSVSIDKVGLALADEGGLELRFADASVRDSDGTVVTIIPLGRIKLSTDAIMSGRFAPESLDILNARVLVALGSDGQLSLGIAQTPHDGGSVTVGDRPAEVTAAAPDEVASAGPDAMLPAVMRRLDIGRVIAEAAERTRRKGGTASYLKSVGLKRANLIVDHGDRKSLWRIADLDIDLAHQSKRSAMSAMARFETQSGSWTLAVHAADVEKNDTVTLKFGLRDLVPSMLARMHPNLSLLETLSLDIGAEATVTLSRQGEVISADIDMVGGKGQLNVPWLEGLPVTLDNARIRARYSRADRRIEILPSTFHSGPNRVTIVGHIVPAAAADGSTAWAFDLRSTEGMLATEEFAIPPRPIETLAVAGHFRASPVMIQLDSASLAVDRSQVQMDGKVGSDGGKITAELNGRIGSIALDTLLAIWPRPVAPRTRDWIGKHVSAGRIDSGSFRLHRNMSGEPEQRASLTMEASGVVAEVLTVLPPIDMPRVLVRVEGDSAEISAPDASMKVKSGRRISLKHGRYTVAGFRSEQPIGEVAARASGPLPAALEVLDGAGFGLPTTVGLTIDGLDGKAEGQFKASFPVSQKIALTDVQLESKIKISEGRAKAAIAGYDVTSATVHLDVTEKSIDGKGDLLVRGSPMKVVWQRFFGVDQIHQPPVRVTAVLDAGERRQLGIDVNHLIQGEVPVEITVSRNARLEQEMHVRAVLTGTELSLDSIAWRKPAGQQATLDFDVVKTPLKKTELQNFKLSGDTIAIEGVVGLGSDNKLRDFHFPTFAINLVSRLDVRGSLRTDNVWEIKARGATFEGRDYFRTLLSGGARNDKSASTTAQQDRGGLIVSAEIDTLNGFHETAAKNVKLQMQTDGRQLVMFDASATLDGRALGMRLRREPGKARILYAESADAGLAFKLIGLYPNMLGGHGNLELNLDAQGAADTSGTLWVRKFAILGDPVVTEVLQSADEGRPAIGAAGTPARQRVVREQIDFDRMRVPFSVGQGQLVLDHSYVQGPLLGATIKGRVDFASQRMSLGGTYVPLHALNSALGQIPVLGQILTGTRGEGIVGINFAIQGAMSRPEVLVHPLSMVTPGIFREIFQLAPQSNEIVPRSEGKSPRAPATGAPRSSSAPPSAAKAGKAPPDSDFGSAWSAEATDGKGNRKR